MWNRIQTAAGGTSRGSSSNGNSMNSGSGTTTATIITTHARPGPGPIPVPVPGSDILPLFGGRKPRRSSTAPTTTASSDELAGDKRYWQNHFDSRLSAFGISENGHSPASANHGTARNATLPYRYEIHRGKTVPTPNAAAAAAADAASESKSRDDDLPSLPSNFLNPPPRNPRRKFSKDFYNRPASSVYGDDDNDDNEYNHDNRRQRNDPAHSVPAGPSRGANMYSYRQNTWAGEQISPPSSPDIGSRDNYMDHDVSPIDDDPDMYQQQYFKGHPHRSSTAPGPSTTQTQTAHQSYPAPQPAPQPNSPTAQSSPPAAQLNPPAMSRPPHSKPAPQPVENSASRKPSVSTSPGRQGKSSIPMMRRERRRLQEANAAGSKDKERELQTTDRERARTQASSPLPGQLPRNYGLAWDTSPEPGAAEGGRSIPGSPEPDEPPYGLTTTITAQYQRRTNNASPSLGERMRQITKNKPEPIENRPAWNGTAGAAPTVKPLRDDPNAAPLKAPVKTNKRASMPKGNVARSPIPPNSPPATHESSYGNAASAALQKFRAARANLKQAKKEDSTPSAKPATRSAADAAASYPSPPQPQTHSPSPVSAERSPPTPAVPSLGSPASAAASPNPEKAIKRKPPPPAHVKSPSHAPQPSTSSSIYSSHPEGINPLASHPGAVTAPASRAPDNQAQPQPPSRFSVTTYAPSNPGTPQLSNEGKRPSPAPEVPSQPSMMDRTRPLRPQDASKMGSDEPIIVTLKTGFSSPAGPGGATHEMKDVPLKIANLKKAERPVSILSIDKDLPIAPNEMGVESGDRIAFLSAKLSSLANRRNNLNMSIKQMTELMPTDSLMASADVLRKREEEKRKVERLRQELGNVQQEEYELGLKLHRAYKRQDRDADFESGKLWVRRVTS